MSLKGRISILRLRHAPWSAARIGDPWVTCTTFTAERSTHVPRSFGRKKTPLDGNSMEAQSGR